MTKEQLAHLNEENMYALMSNEVVPASTRLEAAVLLYQRSSKFCSTSEFQKFKPAVLDKLLVSFKENPPTYSVHQPYEALGRIFDHVNVLTTALGESDRVHQENLSAHRSDLDSSDAALHSRVDQLAARSAEADLNQAVFLLIFLWSSNLRGRGTLFAFTWVHHPGSTLSRSSQITKFLKRRYDQKRWGD
jgi:hypothetical protein